MAGAGAGIRIPHLQLCECSGSSVPALPGAVSTDTRENEARALIDAARKGFGL